MFCKETRILCAIAITAIHFLVTFTANGQLAQPARFEVEHKGNGNNFTVVSMNETGLALIHQKDKYDFGKNYWEVILLDTALQQTWISELELSNQLNLIGYEFAGEDIFYLFRVGTLDTGPLHLIRVSARTLRVTEYDIKPQLDFKLTYFNVIGNSALLGGYVSRQPAIFLHNLEAGTIKLVPGFFAKNTELLDLRTNHNQTFNALILDRSSSEKKLVVRTMDESGALIVDDAIEVDHDKSILSGITSTLVRDELLVAGTWGQFGGKVALGIYTVAVDPFSTQLIHYYAFSEFKHYLDYQSPKKAKRIRAKADARKKQGKLPAWGIYVNAARLAESSAGFALLSEIYSPMSSSTNSNWNYYNPGLNNYGFGSGLYPYGYSPYGNRYSPYGYGNPITRTDVTVKFASVALFDHEGVLIDDAGQKIDDIKLPSIDQVSDFISTPAEIIQVHRNEKDLHINFTERGSTGSPEKVTEPVQMKSSDEILKNDPNDDGALRFWYGKYMYLWGYESVRQNDKTQRVLYVNKLKVE